MLEHPKACTNYSGEIGEDNMDNQQGTYTQAELGWLAGILEGEGSLTMNVRKKNWKGWQGVGVDMTLSIANCDALIIEKARSILVRMTGVEPKIYESSTSALYKQDGSKYQNPSKTMLYCSVGRMAHILTVLQALEPLFAGEKAARARLIMQYIERRLSRKGEHTNDGSAWMDADDWKLVAQFYRIKKKPIPPEVMGLLNEHERTQLLAA
jgi:hypothetical protein